MALSLCPTSNCHAFRLANFDIFEIKDLDISESGLLKNEFEILIYTLMNSKICI